jgi:carbamoylphosphate synthase large subunit
LPDQRSLDAFLKERRSGYCLQRYLDGPEFTVGFLYDSNGKLCDAIAMERTLRGGCTVRGSVVRSQVIKQFMDEFGSRVRGVGSVNAQLRVDSEIGPAVFEINARLSGSTAMRTVVGFNDPIRLVRHFARNEPIAKAKVSDATVYRYLTELVVLAHG